MHALALHLVCIGMALAFKNIDFLFDLLGALMTAFSIFLFPAIGFLTAYSRFSSKWQEDEQVKSWYKVFAWIFLPLGAFIIISAITLNVMRLTGHIPIDSDDD